MSTRLLINEPPLQVLPSLAVKIGLNEAIVLQQVHYWLINKNNKNNFDGAVWVRNTYNQWMKQFPFWAEKTLRRTISNLEDSNLVVSQLTNEGFRRSKFYTIDYAKLEAMGLTPNEVTYIKEIDLQSISGSSPGQIDQIDLPKSANASGQSDQMGRFLNEAITLDNQQPKVGHKSTPSGQNDQIDQPKGQNDQIYVVKMTKRSGQSDQTHLVKMTSSYNKDSETTSENTLPPLKPPLHQLPEEEEELANKMIIVWNETVQRLIQGSRSEVKLSTIRIPKLVYLFKSLMNHQLCEWEAYCKQISGIKFLLGENESGFKVSIDWAIKPENALKVLEGQIYDKPQAKKFKAKDEKSFGEELRNHFEQKHIPLEWLPVYQALSSKLGQQFFQAWLKECEPQLIENDQALILVKTSFQRDYLNSNYKFDLERAINKEFPQVKTLNIELKGGLHASC